MTTPESEAPRRGVAAWAMRHEVLVMLVTASLVVAGIFAARSLASGIYPEVDFPRIGVVVRQGDAPPEVFQASILRPLEESLTTVLGVERVRSRTIRGGAEISLLFAPGSDMWRALQLVQSSVADVHATLPPDTIVHVERLTPVSFPVLSFNVTGTLDPRVLNEIGRFEIAPQLASVHGVGHVSVLGGDVRELEVEVDPERAAALHLRLDDVAARIRRSIPLAAVGRYARDRSLVTVVANAEAAGADDVGSIPIGVDARGVPIVVRDIATVREGAEDRFFRTSSPHGPAVLISVARAEGASTPDVVAGVLDRVRSLQRTLRAGVHIEPVYDQGNLVRESMASVRDAILLGVVLCLVVIGAFLRDARAGFVAAVAVPTTLAMTFVAMAIAKQTLNLMSLGGMAVSIGLVVDDAIVVVEAIARRLEQGDDPVTAACEGTRELTAAVVGTTLTTVVVFVPLVFLPGVVGSFFSALAITLSSAVVLSLFVALFLVPIVAARAMRPTASGHGTSRLEERVGAMVAWSSRRTFVGLGLVASALGFVALALGRVPTGFMPGCDEGAFVIDYETPAGTALDQTDALVRRIERVLRDTPSVATFSRRTGAELGPATVTLLNSGDISVRLRGGSRPHADAIMDDVRARIEASVPGVQLDFIQVLQDMLGDLAGAPHPIEVKLFGPDYAVLERLARDLAPAIESVPGLVDFNPGLEQRSPERTVAIDRIAAARLGLAPDDVSRVVADALVGTNAGAVRRFDRTIGIRVRYPDAARSDPERLSALPVSFGTGVVRLQDVATLRDDTSATVLYREGMEPVVIMHADHGSRDLGSVVRDVTRILDRTRFPAGYRYEIGGQREEQVRTNAQLVRIAIFGLLLVLVVLVAQFERPASALAVLVTAPLSLVGALGALWATGIPLDASSSMGCVLLVGLVVKNGILLIEVAEQGLREGLSLQVALARASERRIRPIVMTTLATLFGLLPLALALGAGSELQRPLAVAVIGGLAFSLLATLGILPSLAALFYRVGSKRSAASSEPANT